MRQDLVGAFAVAALALSGCGAGQDTDEPTQSQSICKYDDETLLPAMEAAVPPNAKVRVSAKLTGPGTEIVMDADLAYTPEGMDADVTLDRPEGPFSFVLLGKRVFFSDSTRSGEYRELRASDVGYVEAREIAKDADVAGEFAAWKAGLEEVRPIGEESVDGQSTCHYAITVNTAEAAEADGEPFPEGAPRTIIYQVFVSADDLIQRGTFDLGGGVESVMTASWGKTFEIKAPTKVRSSPQD